MRIGVGDGGVGAADPHLFGFRAKNISNVDIFLSKL